MMSRICLLSSAYLAPVQYYTKLYAYAEAYVEAYEHYVKQTYRNRCLIASPSGVQALTIPVVKPAAGMVNACTPEGVDHSCGEACRR